jgi:hypothetical protein
VSERYKKNFSWNLDFALNLGEVDRKFFEGLREKKILANKCSSCGKKFVPAQAYCDDCFEKLDEWVEVDQQGEVISWTVTFREFRNMPDTPFVSAAIRVGDSATGMLHFIKGIDYDEPEDIIDRVHVGMDVQPVWKDDRTGDILDIEYFEPV